jgi:hypothetical protein
MPMTWLRDTPTSRSPSSMNCRTIAMRAVGIGAHGVEAPTLRAHVGAQIGHDDGDVRGADLDADEGEHVVAETRSSSVDGRRERGRRRFRARAPPAAVRRRSPKPSTVTVP